ncbi:MAG: hypothetical protein FWC16_01105 [Defluviitaleaceae bacterium]|nr:hypothetical protein [Defluviitaleaceae bacterium]MCL2273502.1 hypothetical protein [Defluviitaleaceae bacterium]
MIVAQSNPVLFVLAGEAANLAPDLTRLLESYHIKAADCVIVPDRDVTHLRAEINRIQQDFLQHRYATAGLARVGYILHDASYLLDLRAHVENILSPLYPSGLITDIYWLTNETSTLDNDRDNRTFSMEVLAKGLPEAQIYLLSNLNSESRHTPWAEVLNTIALLTLFKDGEPREYAAPPDASRYNEFLFLRNAGHESASQRGKPFLTAGSQQLQIPQKALRALLLTALLNPLPLPVPEAPALNIPPVTPWKPDAEYIYGLALPPEAGKIITNGMARRTIISRLFGTRLDATAEMNPPKFVPPEANTIEALLDGYNLFDALEITREGGDWLQELHECIEENTRAVESAQMNLEKWLDAKQELKKLLTDKRKLAFYRQIPNYPYAIATEYVKRICNLQALTQYGEILQQYVHIIADINKKLVAREQAVKEVRKDYEQASTALTMAVSESPLAETDDYFLGLFAQYTAANEAEIRKLTLCYRDEISLNALEAYIETRLLADPIFARSFTEMLASVADDKVITEWVTAARHTHIRLRTAALYSETNLHMPPMWAAQVKYGYEALGHGRANLFTDSSTHRVSVLYHVGSFSAADLYYADLYR